MSEPVTPAAPAREDRDVHIHPEIVDSLVDAWSVGAVWSPGWRKDVYDKAGSKPHAPFSRNLDAPASGPDSQSGQPGGETVRANDQPTALEAADIRAALLRYQAILKSDQPDRDTRPLVIAWDGARMQNVRILGCLNLTYIKFDRSIQFFGCVFDLPILLEGAETGPIDLSGSQFPLFSADSVIVHGNLSLSGVRAFAINVRGAKITGRLEVDNAILLGDLEGQWDRYIGPTGKNLSGRGRRLLATGPGAGVGAASDSIGDAKPSNSGADAARIASMRDAIGKLARSVERDESVLSKADLARIMKSRDWHSTQSSVSHFTRNCHDWIKIADYALDRLPDIDLQRLFDWLSVWGNANNVLRIPLNSDAATIGESAFLNNTIAFGMIRLINTHIGGQFSCNGCILVNIHSEAMVLTQSTIVDSIFLKDEFRAIGGVNFNSSVVSGTFQLGPEAQVEHVDLSWAKADVLDVALDSFPHAGCLTLDGFVYQRLARSSYGATYGLKLLKRQHRRELGWSLRPQPFLQLASVLVANGHPGEARNVLLDLATRKMWLRDSVRWILSPLWLLWRFLQVRVLSRILEFVAGIVLTFSMGVRAGGHRARLLGEKLREELDVYAASWPDVPLLGFLYLPMRIILWATAGHGYRPFRTVPWLVGLWLAGAVIFGAAQERGMIVPSSPPQPSASSSPIGSYPVRPLNHRARFDPGVYSLEVLIPFVDLGQAKYWSPVPAGDLPVAAPAPKAAPKRLTLVQSVVGVASQFTPAAIAQWPAKARGVLDQWLDSGFAANWRWMEALIGWFLATITIGGYTGLVRPLEGPHG